MAKTKQVEEAVPLRVHYGFTVYRDAAGWRTDCLALTDEAVIVVETYEPNMKDTAFAKGVAFIQKWTSL